jgi:negative regulator of sigma E activity
MMGVTDEQIAAYADGELKGAELKKVEAAIAADEALARKVEAHRSLKAMLGGHYAPILDQEVPDRLTAMLKPEPDQNIGEVVSFAAERQKRGLAPMIRRWAPIAGPAIAASLVLVLWQPWQSDRPEGYAAPQLASALDTQLVATQPANAETRILVSFENSAGDLCRAWRGSDRGGIACRDATGWRIESELGLGGAPATEFRQAGSEADLLAAAQDMALNGALNAQAEAEAKARGWR